MGQVLNETGCVTGCLEFDNCFLEFSEKSLLAVLDVLYIGVDVLISNALDRHSWAILVGDLLCLKVRFLSRSLISDELPQSGGQVTIKRES